jgi:hypothetical protein
MNYKKIFILFLILLLADFSVLFSVEYDSADDQLIKISKQNSLNISQKRSWHSKKKQLIKSLADVYQKRHSDEIKEMDIPERNPGSEKDAALSLIRRKGKKPFKWG